MILEDIIMLLHNKYYFSYGYDIPGRKDQTGIELWAENEEGDFYCLKRINSPSKSDIHYCFNDYLNKKIIAITPLNDVTIRVYIRAI